MNIQYLLYFCVVLNEVFTNGFSAGAAYVLPLVGLFAVALIYIALYVFKAIATCTMAKKRGIKWWWVGMLPYVNFILLGKLCGPVKIMRIEFKNIGILVMVSMLVTDLISAISNVYLLVNIYELLMKYQPITSDVAEQIQKEILQLYSNNIIYVLSEVSYVIRLVYIVSYFGLCYAIFGKYAPNRRMVFSVLSLIQPLFPIFLFVVRNNKVYAGYDEYLKQKMAEKYGQSYDPFSNPYETANNPFFNNDENNKEDNSANENPFDEF